MTEKNEFSEIYGLEVAAIPTNRPVIRKDHPDVVYKTIRAKYDAVIDQILECHAKGQPVLVGTVSIDKSETLSKLLSRKGVKHNVLNAKFHDKEAAIVAQAGKYGAVTIATNMAGRGTDIILGGNAEFLAREDLAGEEFDEERILAATSYFATEDQQILADREHYRELLRKHGEVIAAEAEKVKAAGGLFIIGTERHESRRIDDQLRGRSGRQGDPGESRFYLSLEDDLMRLFGGETASTLMDALKVDDDMPIESRMLTGVIESSQKKVEGRNFAIRKSVLSYDDVMNQQRNTIYSERDMVLEGVDIRPKIDGMILESIQNNVGMFLVGDDPHLWNFEGLRGHYLGWLTVPQDFRFKEDILKDITQQEVIDMLNERAQTILRQKEEKIGSELMRLVERYSLLTSVDNNWMEHIDNMDELRKSIHLRSYAQHDPVIEYRREGYAMFDDMIDTIREETARRVLISTIVPKKTVEKNEADAANAGGPGGPVRKKKKIGPNDPCPCGSGKKYKKCHGRNKSLT